MLDFSKTPEGRRMRSNALKILRRDGFQPRNLYPVNHSQTVKEKNDIFDLQALKKNISHELFLQKPLEDVLQQNKGERQEKGRLEIQKAETQPDKKAKRIPRVTGRDAAGQRLCSRPQIVRSRREQKDTGGQRPQEGCWQAKKTLMEYLVGLKEIHTSLRCVCGWRGRQ